MATLTHEEDRDDVVKMDQMVNNMKAKKKKKLINPLKKRSKFTNLQDQLLVDLLGTSG